MIHFSIVIPLYNKANYIIKTLKAVLMQDYADYEIIVVDDGSVDNSLELVTGIKDSRLRVFTKQNGGVSAARNFGIQKSRYEYIAFLDADDLWEPDYLSTLALLIGKYPHSVLYGTAQTVFTKKGSFFKGSKGAGPDYFLVKDFCRAPYLLQTSALCARKEALTEVGMFRVGAQRGEDLDCWLKIACKYQVAYYNKPKVYYFENTEANLNQQYRSYRASFPYWEWYQYPYPFKKSLQRFTTGLLVGLSIKALKNKKNKEVAFLLAHCKGMDYLLKRTVLRMIAWLH